ncbi:MAG: trehalose-phosphatase [Acidobacteriota bacterium]
MRRSKLVALLDIDGTLVPFADTPEQAELDRAAERVLDALARVGVQVVIVSGRPRSSIDRVRAAAPAAWWTAEHGTWYCVAGEWSGPSEPLAELESLEAALELATAIGGIRLERKSRSLCIHWRQVPPELRESAIGATELACGEWLEMHPDFERLEGVELLEIRHRSVSKASVVAWVRSQLPDAHLFAIGDDDTDEDMFAALRDDELAIAVRNLRARPTRAQTTLANPTAVRDFLWRVVETRAGAGERPPPFEPVPPVAQVVRGRLVVVSNRAPTRVSEGRHHPVSGLVSALMPALRTYEGVWLGWSGRIRDAMPTLAIDTTAQPTRASFDLPPRWRDHFYDGFCNRALGPLFHGFPGRARYRDADWQAYVEANDAYAKFASALVEPDGTVWVHDYHLLLVAEALARGGYRGTKGLFLHIPFPAPDLFETLPWCDQLLRAMCAYDLLGFHTQQWADNFYACTRGHHARTGTRLRVPQVGVLPIGVDPLSFAAVDGAVDREVMGLRAVLGSRRLVLGVDRLDYSKGIPERLIAFDRLLERHPEWRAKVTFVQISVPSRVDVPEYAELRERVEHLVGKINGRYGEADWVPVRYLYRSYDHRVLAQLYRLADVALVTPLRDGMNLVAKEFVAAQDPDAPGVLVLSRFAGAATQLTEALLTNPYHPDGLAEDIDRALCMPVAERRRRHGLLAATVHETTPEQWAARFLEQLSACVTPN